MTRSIQEVQHDFALSSGFRNEIIWDSLASDQADILKQKIRALIPDNIKNQNALEKMRANLFTNVWTQRKYTNRNLLSAIIYILVTEETDADLAKQSNAFSCHPVFRTRKCVNASNSAGCCMIFVDEHGRIYQNWRHFLQNNVLPRGTLVAPANGIYTFSDNNEVALECHITPVAKTKAKLLNTTDTMVGVGGLVATLPIAAALAFPIAAPVMLAATAVAMTTAAYSTVRSVVQLSDRRQHGQSMALTDRDARNNWLGVAGGVVGLGATGATQALTYASTVGQEISLATKLTVNGINVSSILLSGTGVANGIYDLYVKISDDEAVSGMDVLQLAASLVVFTHSINNLKMASKVVTKKQGASVRRELGKQMRNMYDRISRETSNLRGGSSIGQLDIIRTVNDIPFRDTLLTLHRINAHLRDASAANELGSSMLHKILLHFGVNPDTPVNLLLLAEEFGCKFVQHIGNPNSLLDVLNAMATYFSENVFRLLMNLSRIFIDQNVDTIDRVLNTHVSTETVLYKILMHCVTKYSNFSFEFIESKTGEILAEIESYFNSLNPVNYENATHVCKTCKGHFYICTL